MLKLELAACLHNHVKNIYAGQCGHDPRSGSFSTGEILTCSLGSKHGGLQTRSEQRERGGGEEKKKGRPALIHISYLASYKFQTYNLIRIH